MILDAGFLISIDRSETSARTFLAAADRSNTYLSAQYHRIRGRRRPGRAAVAVGHSILVTCWHLLSTGETYNDLGGDYFEKRHSSDARQRRLVKQLEALGHTVTLEPAA